MTLNTLIHDCNRDIGTIKHYITALEEKNFKRATEQEMFDRIKERLKSLMATHDAYYISNKPVKTFQK